MKRYLVFLLLPLLGSCTGIPDGITPVKNFDLKAYMSKWYEIARLDHSSRNYQMKLQVHLSR